MAEDLRTELKKLVDQDIPYSRLCTVRQKISDLLYHVEPLDSPDFNAKTAYDIVDKEQVRGEMTDDELKESQKNWFYNVRLSAQSDPDTISVIIGDDSKGIFFPPDLNSEVIISFMNDTDAFIAMTSKVRDVKIKADGGDFEMSVTDFATFSERLIKFDKFDEMNMNSEKGGTFEVGNIVKMERNGGIVQVKSDGEVSNSKSGAFININPDGTISIFNNLADLRKILLFDGISTTFNEILIALAQVNLELIRANTGNATIVNLAPIGNAGVTYLQNVTKLFGD